MTHSHASRQRAGQPAEPECHDHVEPASEQSRPRTVALPGLAVPAGGQPVIRRQKADAVTYATTNSIDIAVSMQTVTNYVNDVSNDKDLRKGLLEAWNLNSQDRWIIDTPADLAKASTNPFHFSNFQQYKDFDKTSQGVSVDAFGGPISAVYKRGAPKLGSNAKNWGKTKLGDTYENYVAGLRSGGMADADIAQALLDFDESALESQLELRAAAMMTVTVYLAEEWRKQGAAKIYRANLRLIAAGTKTFDDFLETFKFIESADAGRRQVGAFYDVFNGDADRGDMDTEDGAIYDVMSPQREDDYSSEDEMRTEDKKNLKGKRLFAAKHKKK
ncbi:MAG: hypothetical protein ABIQ09_19595 [Jatrophihabitantaceae bacterium]